MGTGRSETFRPEMGLVRTAQAKVPLCESICLCRRIGDQGVKLHAFCIFALCRVLRLTPPVSGNVLICLLMPGLKSGRLAFAADSHALFDKAAR
jgi:hypothetical protein